MGDDKQICRLCLDRVPAADAEAIGEKKKTILEVLLINVDLHVTENAVACSRCMDALQNGFEFKSACLQVDKCIFAFVDADVSVDIKEDLQGGMSGTTMANVNSDNRQICLLCRSVIADEALDCNTDLKEIIANCLPEVDIHTVHEPLVCGLCFSRIKKLNEFMKTCQEVERRINNYCQAAADHIIPVSLKDLLKFKDSTINRLVKEECSNFVINVGKDLKKEETATVEYEGIHIKNELESGDEMGDSVPSGACNNLGKRNSSIGHMAKDPRAEKKFKCDKCPDKTNCKCHVLKHNPLTHMDKSEVELHKCDNCDYETKWKSNLKNHMLKHLDPKVEKKFKCDKCPYKTNYKCDIRKHNLLMHVDKSEVKMHKCENCEYETKWKSDMKKHVVRNHDPKAANKFKCDQCPYETDLKSCLRMHNSKHKDKPEVPMYKCVNCEFEACDKDHMIAHMLAS